MYDVFRCICFWVVTSRIYQKAASLPSETWICPHNKFALQQKLDVYKILDNVKMGAVGKKYGRLGRECRRLKIFPQAENSNVWY